MRNIQALFSFDLPTSVSDDTIREHLVNCAKAIEKCGGRFRQFVIQPIDVVSTEVENVPVK